MKLFKIRMSIFVSLSLVFICFCFLGWILLPKFLESLNYEVKRAEGPFQLRLYETFIETKIQTDGQQNEALRKGFIPLARFIGAKNGSAEKISMTVPVIQRKIKNSGNWFVSFSMPSKYTMNTLPTPQKDELLQVQVPKTLMAVIKFNGKANERLLAQKEYKLRNWINKISYEPIGAVHYYFYNDPLTPGIFRRNEVLFEVSKIQL